MIYMKRAYEAPSPSDGRRILVERLWPRGVTREKAALDLWLKDVAPSPELRRWFDHDPAKWPEFRQRYLEELRGRPEEVAHLRKLADEGTVTFVYGSRDERHNSASVLKDFVDGQEDEETADQDSLFARESAVRRMDPWCK
jgi:uncharacterized protein YeaO (DUF488 family)